MGLGHAPAAIPMGGRVLARVAWSLCALAVALVACAVVFAILNRTNLQGFMFLAGIASSAVVGGVVASRRPANPVGWFFVASAVCYAAAVAMLQYAMYGLVTRPDSLPLAQAMAWPPTFLFEPGIGLILIFMPLYFPDGRLVSRRWRPVVWLAVLSSVFGAGFLGFRPGEVHGFSGIANPLGIEALQPITGVLNVVTLALGTGLFFVSAASLVVRFRRSAGEEHQQIKWLTYAVAAWFVVVLLTYPADAIDPALSWALDLLLSFVFAAIPVAAGVAILRYRLYDIDLIINRTLVYGALTACVVGIYVLGVGYLGAVFRTGGNLAISLVATGIVAVLFQPLRERLQRGANRLMYGERDDPYAVISRLGERLEATIEPEAVLPTVARTVREALRLPYAAIALGEGEESTVAAESGSPADDPLRLPLVYQGETVGELLLGPRVGEEGFSPADRRLLEDLTRQAGIAVHAVRLTTDLQRSRERLVTTREEERRRLRRDLHDGLGPTLGSLPLKLDVADDLLERDPAAARELLRGLKSQTQSAVADIRRLVYELRPPTLDDLGLAGAIREAAAQHGANGLRVSVEAPEELPPLPAAVEVAAYRIAQEAVNNTARHAAAGECRIQLALDEESGALRLEISDDGRGLPPAHRSGVGLSSMRERAGELGGECIVESLPEGGTCARASLPLAKHPEPEE